ncbi:MAG: sialate O-acetylesterase [Verrucomicrobiota bacterium]
MKTFKILLGIVTLPMALVGSGFAKEIDVFLMAGQSNMVGCGLVQHIQDELKGMSGYKKIKYVLLNSGEEEYSGWGPWEEKVRGKRNIAWFGVDLPFGEILGDKHEGEYGIIKIARGSTSIVKHWHPDETRTDEKLYDHFVQNAQAAIQDLEKEGYNVTIKGFFWYQGEGDCAPREEKAAMEYGKNLRRIREKVREDFESPDLPFIAVRIHPQKERWEKHKDKVRDHIVAVCEEDPKSAWIDVDDLKHLDKVHLGTKGLFTLADRFYEAWVKLDR